MTLCLKIKIQSYNTYSYFCCNIRFDCSCSEWAFNKNRRYKELTAETSVSAVNEQNSEPVSENSDGKVTLCAVGDNLIHNTLIDAGKQEDGSYDYTSLYQNIAL